jgi:hypothetical protein
VSGLLHRLFAKRDPYWDRFVNQPFVDPKNMLVDLITASPGGGVFAVKTDVHDPAAMSAHMIQLAEFWGASATGVAATEPAWAGDDPQAAQYPFAIVCGVLRGFDANAQGMGGRHAEQKLAVVNFNLRSYIREIGYGAEFVTPISSPQAAAAAGIGTISGTGELVAKGRGRGLALGQVVVTDLPLQPHSPAGSAE